MGSFFMFHPIVLVFALLEYLHLGVLDIFLSAIRNSLQTPKTLFSPLLKYGGAASQSCFSGHAVPCVMGVRI